MARMAVEDIGLADPRALRPHAAKPGRHTNGSAARKESWRSPNAVVYLACAPKSNAVYVAMAEAMADVEKFGTLEVPLRCERADAPHEESRLRRNYRYAHDEPDAFAAGERYLPESHAGSAILPACCPWARDRRSARRWRGCAREADRKVDDVIDPKLLRRDPEAVARNLARRGFKLDVAALQALEDQRKPWQVETRSAARRAQRQREGGGHGQGRGEDAGALIAAARA